MKRTYIQPAMLTAKLQQMQTICQTSIKSFNSNLTGDDAISISDTPAGSGTPARVKEQNDWDEEW